jgi:hypothetical protein
MHNDTESAAGEAHDIQLDLALNMENEGQLVTPHPAVAPLQERSVRAADMFRKLEAQAASEAGKAK